jgi:hypothetical protein
MGASFLVADEGGDLTVITGPSAGSHVAFLGRRGRRDILHFIMSSSMTRRMVIPIMSTGVVVTWSVRRVFVAIFIRQYWGRNTALGRRSIMVRLMVTVTVVRHVFGICGWGVRLHGMRSKVLLPVPVAGSILTLDFRGRLWLAII